jgi:cytochrome P450
MGTPTPVRRGRAVITGPAERRTRKGAPPCPRAHPLLGSALDLRCSQAETYARVMREHGDVVRLAAGPPGLRLQLYCVFHPDGVRQVLAGSRDSYTKRNRFYVQIAEAIGWGLLTTEGECWQRQRRLIQPLFTRKQIVSYADLMAEEAAAVAQRWESAARDGAGVNAHAEMGRLTLRVVGRSIFGDDVEEAVTVLDSAFPVLNRHTFRRAMSPAATPASWPTPANRQAARARQALYGVVDELIARRVQAGADGQDLVSRLLSARDADTGEPMNAQQVRDEALIFLLAGHETTSTALTFTLHLLGRHPGEQARVHDELDAVLDGRPPTAADLPALRHTTMAIKEAMRLYPPAYAIGRRSEAETEIGGYVIPAGSDVVVSQYATHRHPQFWHDAERFDPSRFTPEREQARHPHAYFPFGGGPRACIGSQFAMLEAVIAVAALLQHCNLRSELARIPVDTAGITLRPKGPVPIQPTRR